MLLPPASPALLLLVVYFAIACKQDKLLAVPNALWAKSIARTLWPSSPAHQPRGILPERVHTLFLFHRKMSHISITE